MGGARQCKVLQLEPVGRRTVRHGCCSSIIDGPLGCVPIQSSA